MGIKFSDLTAGKTECVTFEFDGNSITLTYYPAQVQTTETLALLDRASKAMVGSATSIAKEFDEMLCRLVVAWDVMEDDNLTMFPIEAPQVTPLPLDFKLKACMAMIQHTMRPQRAVEPQIRYVN